MSNSQYRRCMALGTGVHQVIHSEVLGSHQDSNYSLKSGQSDFLQHLGRKLERNVIFYIRGNKN